MTNRCFKYGKKKRRHKGKMFPYWHPLPKKGLFILEQAYVLLYKDAVNEKAVIETNVFRQFLATL
jgi:hypothetical protein